MSTLEQIREGLGQAWEQVADGWRHLRERAGNALTRFQPTRRTVDAIETSGDRLGDAGARWGLLAAELVEHADELEVRLEIPGMEADGFDISVQDQSLIVRGEKLVSRERQSGRYFLRERAYGAFERALPLPAAVDEARAEARYQDGVLTIRLPKQATAQRRRINVEAR